MIKKLGNMKLVDFFHKNTVLSSTNDIKILHNIKRLYSNNYFTIKSNAIPYIFLNNKNNIQLGDIEENSELYNLLKFRRTNREFIESKPLNFNKFSNIIKSSLGITDIVYFEYFNHVKYSYPTAGGFNSLLFYIIINNVEGVDEGVYLYNPYNNKLILENTNFKFRNYKNITSASNLMKNSFFTLYVVADLKYSIEKYGDRAYRFSHLEAGHVGQNIYLTCEYNKLSAIASGSFYDLNFFKYLNIDSEDKYLFYEIIVGKCYEE